MLLAEGLQVQGRRAGLLALFGPEGVTSRTTLPLGGLISRHGGLKDPYIGGTDLRGGILFSARDDQGRAWSDVYVIGVTDGTMTLDSISSEQACACPVYVAWKHGTDGRTLFGDVTAP